MHMAAPPQSARAWRILTWCAIAAFAAFRLPELTRYSLWYDELFSLTLAQGDWHELVRRAIADRTNPPLFYALLKVWIGIGGDSVVWVRLLPCLLGILVAIPLVALARRWTVNRATVIVVVAVAAASPLAVFLSNEVRGYSLLLLLATMSYLAYERGAPIVALAVVNTALVYTHYFGWLVVAAEVVDAAMWRRTELRRTALRRVGSAAAVTAAAFAPWALAVRASARDTVSPLANVDWIRPPTLSDVPAFFDALVARVLTPGTAWIGAVVVGAPLVVLALRVARSSRAEDAGRNPALRLALLAAFPVALVFAASVAMHRSAFVPRYLIVAAPAWWLLVAHAAGTLAGARPTRRLTVTFAAFTLTAGVARERRGGEKIRWERVIAAIGADAGPDGGTLYALEGFTALPAAYYAATLGTRVTVRPARTLSAVTSPAWLVVRSQPGQGATSVVAALRIAGRRLTPLIADTVPSHIITAYRVGGP